MRTQFVAFDCETTGLSDTDTITCIATISVADTTVEKIWHGTLGETIDVATLCQCVDYLWHLYRYKKYAVVSFNGVSFDFRVMARMLASKPDYVEKIELLALGGEDIMLDFATEHGYFAGMQSFADGCQVAGKTQTGAWAVTQWLSGVPEQQQAMLEYCMEDVRVLCRLVQYRAEKDCLLRKTKKETLQQWMPQARHFRPGHACIEAYTKKPVTPNWFTGKPTNIPAMWSWI